MIESGGYQPVTLPQDMVAGGELITPVARTANESQDESNRKAWFAALTAAYSKRSELGNEAVRINLGQIVEAALANGMKKPELADHLRAMGVGVTLKSEAGSSAASTPDTATSTPAAIPVTPETTAPPEAQGEYPPWIDDIVNNDQYQVYLHRTDFGTAQKVLTEGFQAGPELKSTATASGSDRQSAFEDFKKIHKDLPAVIIFRVPNRVLEEVAANKAQAAAATSAEFNPYQEAPPVTVSEWLLTHYYDAQSGGIKVPKEWIYGYADQNTLNLTKNLNYDPSLSDINSQ